MSTIYFRIAQETKRLAMKAAERHKMSLAELMRQRAEELAAEELQYQNNEHERWLERQIAEAFDRCDRNEDEYISDDESNARMARLKRQASREKR